LTPASRGANTRLPAKAIHGYDPLLLAVYVGKYLRLSAAGGGMEIILILGVPLVIGGMWGFWQARSRRFSFAVLLTAPLVSAALLGVMFAMMNMLDPPDSVVAKPLGERITIHVATGCLYGAGFGLFGAVPALVASAATQLVMLWAFARHAKSGQKSAIS
jgi:hypothetical protein